jgi:hypothetical protein
LGLQNQVVPAFLEGNLKLPAQHESFNYLDGFHGKLGAQQRLWFKST